jgi:hypothetical protein
MGSKRNPRSTTWPKPLFLVCAALSLCVPLLYFQQVDLDLFIASNDEHQVRYANPEPHLCETLLTSLTLYACICLCRLPAMLLPRRR